MMSTCKIECINWGNWSYLVITLLDVQVYSIDKTSEYRHQFDTTRLNVPYFVKDPTGFERQHPAAGRERCAACFACPATSSTSSDSMPDWGAAEAVTPYASGSQHLLRVCCSAFMVSAASSMQSRHWRTGVPACRRLGSHLMLAHKIQGPVLILYCHDMAGRLSYVAPLITPVRQVEVRS